MAWWRRSGARRQAFAVALTIALFKTIGPKRTRLVAQIVAAVIGAAFVIGLQVAAILSYGSLSRTDVLASDAFVALAPDVGSVVCWPARAVLGDVAALAGVLGAASAARRRDRRCSRRASATMRIAAAGVSEPRRAGSVRRARFRPATPQRALRRKEWTLLRRDPWLMSQTLMQMLYLLPPAFLLWRSFGDGDGALVVLVPVLVMAAGQLAGGLAWLAISGEDAPDLVATAPVSAREDRARQDRSGHGRHRDRVPAVRRGARAGCRPGTRGDRARHHRGLGSGDRNPALVPRPGQAQPLPPPADVLARGHLRGGVLVDRLGRRPRRWPRPAPGSP